MRRALVWGGGVVVVLLVAFVILLRPTLVPSFDGTPYLQNGTKYDVRVLRDTFGVPHVYGKRDEDVAFGLAYAHAEDDFLTIQQSLMTSRGRLALVDSQTPRLLNAATGAVGLGRWFDAAGGDPAITDYLVQLFRVRARIDGQMKSNLADGRISRKTYNILAAYADGINLYAAQHPDRVVAGFSGVSADDIAAGFVFFTPFFFGIDRTVGELFGPERAHEISVPQGAGSNAMAVAPARAADSATRLLINSHQPYTGPLAWYEARVKSEEGWDMVGGIFPGTPFILHGFGPVLGWANTVNNPDLADVYVLTVNPDNSNQYRYDGAWRDFERSTAELQLRIAGPVAIRVTRDVLWSVYGPVLQRPHGTYALRYATMDKINQVEAYYRLNRASNMDAVMGALELQALPSFNFTYADRAGNIAYIYNAVFPKRDGAYDWQKYLPGDTSRTLWSGYEPFSAVPKIVNPKAGFVYNANNTPFTSTAPEEDLKPSAFAPSLGVDTRETNRGFRLQELLSADASITRDEFYAIKYDKRYSARSKLAALIARITAMDFSKEPDAAALQKAQALLKAYDLSADAENRGAALAIMVGLPVVVPTFQGKPEGDILAAMRGAIATLTKHHGRLDPEWGEVNRFRRGTIDAPANGGPDVLRDFESDIVPQADGKFEARKGDTLYYFVEWDKAGRVRAEGIHQFGAATLDETSPHYADQAAIFLKEQVKPIWLDEAELRKNFKREYRPGR